MLADCGRVRARLGTALSGPARRLLGPTDEAGSAQRGRSTPLSIDALCELSRRLIESRDALKELSCDELSTAWKESLQVLRDPASAPRTLLREQASRQYRLSPSCLDASLDSLLAGYSDRFVEEVLERAQGLPTAQPIATILAGNLPGLVLEPLLAATALRQPLLIKPARGRSSDAAVIVAELGRRLPAVAEGSAVVEWNGGDRPLEDRVLALWPRIVAYGSRTALDDLARLPSKLIAFGPRFSLGLVFEDAEPEAIAALGLDIAYFDQQGCLSVRLVYAAEPRRTAEILAEALDRAEILLPARRSAQQQVALTALRSDAELHGGLVGPANPGAGAVEVVSSARPAHPGEGLRSVQVRPLGPSTLVSELGGFSGLLQGAAIAGTPDPQAIETLKQFGVSRLAPAGTLQAAPAGWHHDGIDLLQAIASSR